MFFEKLQNFVHCPKLVRTSLGQGQETAFMAARRQIAVAWLSCLSIGQCITAILAMNNPSIKIQGEQMEREEYLNEIERYLDDQYSDDLRYTKRQRVGSSVLAVTVRKDRTFSSRVAVDLTRIHFERPPLDAHTEIIGIDDPEELAMIARLALDAREEMLRLQGASPAKNSNITRIKLPGEPELPADD